MSALFRCLDCGKIFKEGFVSSLLEADEMRPTCPRCHEDIDIEELGDLDEEDDDATGFK